jgi:hypothetical protein
MYFYHLPKGGLVIIIIIIIIIIMIVAIHWVYPSLGIPQGLVPEPPQFPKLMDAQVPSMKWHGIHI